MEEWDNLISGAEAEEKNEWDGEWFCESCEFGPMPETAKKCDRCSENQNAKWPTEDIDEDGYPKEEVEEIY